MIISIIITFLFNFSYSQEKDSVVKYIAPDYNKIEKNIKDKNSKFYYEKLMKKYKSLDTTMTKDEMKHLYYGSCFQEGYNSYASEDKTRELNELLNKPGHTKEQLYEILDLANTILETEKFNMNMYNYMLYAYEQLKDRESFDKVKYILLLLYSTLIESGDGLSCESAFHVLYTYNEYNILSFIGFRHTSQALSGECDILMIEANEFKIDQLFFNISRFNMNLFDE